jgi:hypothetical protein
MTTAPIIYLPPHKQMMVLAFLPQAQASANIFTYNNAESDTDNMLNAKAKVAQKFFRFSKEIAGT